jgi:hypothetical protein
VDQLPDWIMTALNTSFAGGFGGFVLWGFVRMSRFLGPKITTFFETHVSLIESLKTNQQSQTSLMERQTAMLDDHGRKLDSHGNVLGFHSERLERIERAVSQAGPKSP